jgi:hypothetical protein
MTPSTQATDEGDEKVMTLKVTLPQNIVDLCLAKLPRPFGRTVEEKAARYLTYRLLKEALDHDE